VRAMNLRWGLGRVKEAHDLLAEAERRVTDVDARSTLSAIRSAGLVLLGRYAEALDVATAVMQREEVALRRASWPSVRRSSSGPSPAGAGASQRSTRLPTPVRTHPERAPPSHADVSD
jgi:hypothetical protein